MASYRNKLEELCLVAKVGLGPLYAGWDSEGLPILCTSITDLSEKAQQDLATFSKSRSFVPKIPLRSNKLNVVVVSVAGQVQDIKDSTPKYLAQDTIKIIVTDSSGVTNELTLGELEVLKMIAEGMITFQKLGTIFDSPDRQEAVEIFSFFLPGSRDGSEDRPDLLLLFKPTNENLGNLIDITLFVSDVVKKFISNDRRQPAGYKKGYLDAEDEAEKQIAKQQAKEKGIFGFFFEPVTTEQKKSNLKDMITDFFYVPADGSKPNNPFMVPVERKPEFSEPSKNNLNLLRTIASKMYLYARSRIGVE